MRYTLIAGLLVFLPTAALLASAAVALLIAKMRQAVKRGFDDPDKIQTEPDRPLAVMGDQEGMRDDASLNSVPAGRLHVVQVSGCLFSTAQECQYPALAWSHGSR